MQDKNMRSQGRSMTTKTMVCCALLAAINIILARFISLMPSASTRFSIEAIPVTLAGLLFGPLAGGMVGFSADFIGCLFTPFGYNPLLSVPPILYGVFGGLFQRYLQTKISIPRVALSLVPPVVLGSVLYQSAALAAIFFKGPFLKGFAANLAARGVQFSIALVLDTVILYFLLESGVFQKLGMWPGKSAKAK